MTFSYNVAIQSLFHPHIYIYILYIYLSLAYHFLKFSKLRLKVFSKALQRQQVLLEHSFINGFIMLGAEGVRAVG